MKKILGLAVTIVFLGIFLAGVVPSLEQLTQQAQQTAQLPRQIEYSANGTLPPENISNESNPLNLTGGVYNVSDLNVSGLLDPTQWYVGNNALSMNYAQRVYNDTLNIVENSTQKSETILDRFLGVFHNLFGDNSSLSRLLNSTVSEFEKIGDSLKHALGNRGY